ncbi:MAG TPA: copper amine oxidase N-terminal domain-containing protein [Firmicutes bacterium]|nr:copper amine oxidase N-terminal domain-containing protein [Bacillota bacterium]
MKKLKKLLALVCALAMTGSVLTAAAWAAPAAVSLQVNGEEVVLTDAAPEIRSGRTFIPARAVFEALGAAVTWDEDSRSAVAVKEGTTVVMTIGSETAQVTENGATREIAMDVAPYIKGGRTYVPARFAAQALDCAVGWDEDARTVIVVDVPALFGGADFTLMDGWMAASLEETAPDPARTSGTASLELTVSDGTETAAYPLDMTFDILTSGEQMQLQVSMDLSDFLTLLTGGALNGEEQRELLALCDAAAEVRMDAAAGKVYFTVDSPLLMYLTGNSMGNGDLWYLLDLGELFALSGMDYSALLQEVMAAGAESFDFKDIMIASLAGTELTDAELDYDMLSMTAEGFCALFSDQALVKNGNTYAASWEVKDDASGEAAQIDVVYETRGGRLVGMEMDVSAAAEGQTIDVLTMDVYDDGTNTSMTFDFDLGTMALAFDLTARTAATSDLPAIEPPAGSETVDLTEMLTETETAQPADPGAAA